MEANSSNKLDALVLKLFEIEAVKFGDFKLKSGIQSPVYFDLRVLVSFPDLLADVSDQLWESVQQAEDCKFDSLCGVPYTALPLATCMSVKHNIPMLMRRKEAKDYGTKKMIEGRFNKEDVCLVVEDVVTSGSSVQETVECLAREGIQVKDAVVLLNREQGGQQNLLDENVNLHSVCTLSRLMQILHKAGKVDDNMVQRVKTFIAENSCVKAGGDSKRAGEQNAENGRKKNLQQTYSERLVTAHHPLAKKLFQIMEAKSTNLALSADVTTCEELLKFAENLGPYICVLKTHVDILEGFDDTVTAKLKKLADELNFLIFEDRKFADIGNTVRLQYEKGMYRISDWADLVNAHTFPGPSVIEGLKQVGLPKGRGCLLLAEMSTEGCLMTDEYTKATVKMAEQHPDFVMGFISQRKLSEDPGFLHMTPGVQLQPGGDSLGQQYNTPEKVITEKGSDIIIVGRGILKAADPVQAAKEYQQAGWKAYLARLSA